MYEMIKLKYNYKDLEPYYSSDMFNYHYNTLYKNYQNHYLLMQMLIYYIVYFLKI